MKKLCVILAGAALLLLLTGCDDVAGKIRFNMGIVRAAGLL